MFNIKYDLAADIAKVSKMLGVSESDFVNSALERELVLYRDPDRHKVKAEKAQLWENHLECTLQEETKPIWKDCYILYKREIFGQKYVSVLVDGRFLSVPANCVKVSGEQSEVNK